MPYLQAGSIGTETIYGDSGITAGYNASCPHCGKYNDIWACGIREVDCGNWHSQSFLSSYGTPTAEEAALEKKNLRKLNRLILLEKLKYFFQRKETVKQKAVAAKHNKLVTR